MQSRHAGAMIASWLCPVCPVRLTLTADDRRWECASGHSFDVAREGYVNLLLPQRRHSRQPGDSAEMIAARRRFLATGAYDPMSAALAEVVGRRRPVTVLDVGCGEGRHTRFINAPLVQGLDVAKGAVAAAARSNESGWYAVASASDLPVADSAIDVAMVLFSPVIPAELGRVVRPGGSVVIAHPGPSHLDSLRSLVYPDARRHDPRAPIADTDASFAMLSRQEVTFPVVIPGAQELRDLYAMTPYRWHAPRDIEDRLTTAATNTFTTTADITISLYERRS
ncbi:MAG TPA: methyltransferase domain-containing protein [Streptosporangiaceae bacterium]|nr:methyltransferase domain-containing protein [Streptosporangiaceae bacterium]